MSSLLQKRASWAATAAGLVLVLGVVPIAMAGADAVSLKKGLKVFVIPKNLGNPYFTTADSVRSGGALAALKTLGEKGTETIGRSEVALLAKQIGKSGDIAILSAAASATNQNAWIGFMKKELTKYPNMKLVSTVYGNDDPTTSTQVAQGLLQQYPDLKGIISPTTVGIAAAAAVLDTPKYRGKVKLTGLGTPNSLRKYVKDGTIEAFELWNPADLGYLAAYAAVNLESGTITSAAGKTFRAGRLGRYKVGRNHTVLLGPPFVFNKANIDKFHF